MDIEIIKKGKVDVGMGSSDLGERFLRSVGSEVGVGDLGVCR